METRTLLNVKNLLVASNYHFLDGDVAFQMFAEDVRKYTDEEVLLGAKQFVRNPGKFPNYPGLLDAIRTEHYAREDYASSRETWNTGVRCKKCGDRGYYFRYWKKALGDGNFLYTETMRACPCAAGRERFPSLLETQAERDKWTFESARKGGQPTKVLYDYTEEEFRNVVGEEITKSQYDREFAQRLRYVKQEKPKKDDTAELWKELVDGKSWSK